MSKKEERVSMREAVARMDNTAVEAINGKKTVALATMTIGEVRTLIRLVELQVQAAKASGKTSQIPDLDFIDLS